MKANAVPLLALFEKKMRLEVPLFQRQYVWGEVQQWAPLWEDISRKFTEHLIGRTDAPVHFLGAVVLDQKQTPATHVERRLVIDGQQRLTTFQVFLAAFRDLCRANEATALADECANFTLNKGLMPDPEVDRFKVWPTQLDRKAFSDALTSGSADELIKRHPLTWRKYARKPDPRHRIVEAYLFFAKELNEYFCGTQEELPVANEYPIEARLEQCFQALRSALQVVAIDLEQGDDAQVIFETLNARGEPLLPADLLRNYIFLRAARHGESQEKLYQTYWQAFDEPFWRDTVSQGRINRPRSDLFMQHYLASQQTIDIPISHLYVEYRHWVEKHRPFGSVEEELESLASFRGIFRALIDAEPGKPFSDLAGFLRAFDVSTAYPLLMHLLASELPELELNEACQILESYLVRRAICGLTNKNYNRVFLNLTRNLKKDGPSSSAIIRYLIDLRGESTEWPSDEAFQTAWMNRELYTTMSSPRIVHLLRRLDSTFYNDKMDVVQSDAPLTVEHLMPQNWVANWPLTDGQRGLTDVELWDSAEDDPLSIATRARSSLVQTMGNLTIVRQALNSAVSNSDWATKKAELASHALLPINVQLQNSASWDESAIVARSKALFERALVLWPKSRAGRSLADVSGQSSYEPV